MPASGHSSQAELTPTSAYESARYFPALDGLRTIAVGMVFLVHFFPGHFTMGWAGVQIFFVLSGFLITGILHDSRNDPHRLRNFYMRRTLRIFPLYYAVLLACIAVIVVTQGTAPPAFWLWTVYAENFWWIVTRGLASDVLFTGSHHAFAALGHLWSLAVEEQFYLLWPIVVFSFRRRVVLLRACVVLIFLRLILALYWQTHLSPELLGGGIIYRMLPTQCDGFLMGGFLALWIRGDKPIPAARHAGAAAFAAIAAYSLLLAFMVSFSAHRGLANPLRYTSGFQAVAGLTLCNLVALAVLIAAITPSNWVFRFCNLPALRSLGKVSYGLYVFHLPVFVLCIPLVSRLYSRAHLLRGRGLATAILATLLTTAVSYLSYYLYEKRFLRLKARFPALHGAVRRRDATD